MTLQNRLCFVIAPKKYQQNRHRPSPKIFYFKNEIIYIQNWNPKTGLRLRIYENKIRIRTLGAKSSFKEMKENYKGHHELGTQTEPHT